MKGIIYLTQQCCDKMNDRIDYLVDGTRNDYFMISMNNTNKQSTTNI